MSSKVVSIEEYKRRASADEGPSVDAEGDVVVFGLGPYAGVETLVLSPTTARQWGLALLAASDEAEGSADRITLIDGEALPEETASIEEGGPSGAR